MMANNNPAHTLEEVLAAADKGITKTGAAHILKVHRDTVANYCKRWKTAADAFEEKRREMVDLAEMGLRGAIMSKQPWAITFTLRTLGKNDGYSDRTELTGADGTPLIPIKEVIVALPNEETVEADGE